VPVLSRQLYGNGGSDILFRRWCLVIMDEIFTFSHFHLSLQKFFFKNSKMKKTGILILMCIVQLVSAQYYTPQVDSIPMRDGKKIAADIYLASSTEALPTILVQTPYNRLLYRFNLPLVGQALTQNHYNFVITDWRGFYGSASAFVANYDKGLDGYDIVEWIAQQSWSNGKIGTWGPSALGKIQYQTAKENPPHLVCCVPLVAFPMTLYQEYFQGGVYRTEYVEQLDQLGYGLSTWTLANPFYNLQWQYVESSTNYPSSIKVPMFMIGGWYDHNIDGMISFFNGICQSSPVGATHKLLMGPWVHGGHGSAYVGSSQQGELTFNNASGWSDSLALRFFDYYLRNLANNWQNEPVFRYYQIGDNEWRSATSTSAIITNETNYYLSSLSELSLNIPVSLSQSASLIYNPHDPSPTHGGSTLRQDLLQGPYDQSQVVESRNDILIFSTPPLASSLQIYGKPKARLYVSSNCKDTDFAIRLCDVYPDGTSMLISDGIKRMRFRNGYRTTDTASMQTGVIYAVDVDLPCAAYTFLAGHRVRLDITSSNYPRFDNNLNNGQAMYVAGDTITATNTVYFELGHESYLSLPVCNSNNLPSLYESNRMVVYPNPASSYIEINLPEEILSIKLFDSYGKEINLPEQHIINISNLRSGIYMIHVTTLKGNVFIKKLIKE